MLEREKQENEVKRAIEEKMKSAELKQEVIQEKLKEQRTIEVLEKEKERREKALLREKKIEEMEISKRMYGEKKLEEREHRLQQIRMVCVLRHY